MSAFELENICRRVESTSCKYLVMVHFNEVAMVEKPCLHLMTPFYFLLSIKKESFLRTFSRAFTSNKKCIKPPLLIHHFMDSEKQKHCQSWKRIWIIDSILFWNVFFSFFFKYFFRFKSINFLGVIVYVKNTR